MTAPFETDILMRVLAIRAGNVSIVPIDYRTKRPCNDLLPRDEAGKPVWGPYQHRIADEEEIRSWFAAGLLSFAVIGGDISGGLLILDFEDERFYHAWCALVGDLADGLPVQRTGGGGFHVFLRCSYPGGNTKLAWMECATEETGREVAIETRGESGYAVVAPSLHPNGNHYQMLVGDLTAIPTISQARADALIAAARKLDEAPHTRQERERIEREAATAHQRRVAANRNGSSDVIGQFNAAHSIASMLESHGYMRCGERFKRPGGRSASVSVKDGRSCHFSSNDPLNDGRVRGGIGVHDAFDVYAHLEHGGDVNAAVKAAARRLGIPPNVSSCRSAAPIELTGPHGVTLRAIDVAKTTTKYTARFEVLVDGTSTEMDLTASDTAGGQRNAWTSLSEILKFTGKSLDGDAGAELKAWLNKQLSRRSLAQLHDRLEHDRQPAAALEKLADDRPTMQGVAAQFMREQLELRFVEPELLAVWSERLGIALRQHEFTSRIEPGLLEAIKGCSDYPAGTPSDPTKPIKQLQQVLKPVWCEVTQSLPREVNADLGPDSKAAERFRQKLIRLWLAPETWMKFDSASDTPAHVERMSLASRVREMIPQALQRPSRWQRVLRGVNAFFRVEHKSGAHPVVWLGMRVDLLQGEIKGCVVPGIESQHDLAILANRYGIADTTGVPTFITDDRRRRRLVVLSRTLCDYLIDCEDEPQKAPLRAGENASATEVIDGARVDLTTGEVLDAT